VENLESGSGKALRRTRGKGSRDVEFLLGIRAADMLKSKSQKGDKSLNNQPFSAAFRAQFSGDLQAQFPS
jgi:hypothetical protein